MEPVQTVPSNGFAVGNKVYDVLKFVVMLFLPAVSTLYFGLGAIWDLPNVEQVVGSIAAIAAFLGALTGLSTKAYKASEARYGGVINVSTNEVGTKTYSLDLVGEPDDLSDLTEVIFKIGSRS